MLKNNKDNRRKRLILLAIILLLAGTISTIVAVAVSSKKVNTSKTSAPSSSEDNSRPQNVPVSVSSPDTLVVNNAIKSNDTTTTTSSTSEQLFKAADFAASNASSTLPVKMLSVPLSPVISSSGSDAPTTPPAAVYTYKDINFAWKDSSNWEWADGSPMADAASKFSNQGITVDSTVRKTPMRTRKGWGGEKVVYVAWTANAASDTNIWMLNTKIKNQFAANNGWPYFGEIDIFEMFTNDAVLKPNYDFAGFKNFQPVNSYGQLTLHYSTSQNAPAPCFCPASPTKAAWFENQYGMTSGCTAQFTNTPNQRNEIALVFGSDNNGKYLQVIQFPVLVPGSSNTYDVKAGPNSKSSGKIYNNKDYYWGSKITECNSAGQNPATGFPFFEDFRLILEEQSNGQFIINDIKILTKS